MTNAWEEIYQKDREIDDIRLRLSIATEAEVLASKVVERCVDISREVAKGMKGYPETMWIDFSYIMEKYNKLKDDIEYLEAEIRRKRGW